jgi:hypothetical protein
MKRTTARRNALVKQKVREAMANKPDTVTQHQVMEGLSKSLGYSISHLYLILRMKAQVAVDKTNDNQLNLF